MKIFLWTSMLFVVCGGLLFAVKMMDKKAQPSYGQYDTFAQCINDSGAFFYGAFWCSHCQEQKKEFGDSEKLLPYVECSTPDTQGQTPICKEKEITSYPTWIFKDGSRLSGKVDWQKLSEKTSCVLPVNMKSSL